MKLHKGSISVEKLLVAKVAIAVAICCSVACAEEIVLRTAPVRVISSSESDIFPESWRKPPIDASGNALDETQFDRISTLIERALSKYPEAVLTKHLKAIYVLSDLRYSGIVAGGTNSRTAVYLKVGDIKKGYTDANIENIFHAEFSSILWRNARKNLDTASWKGFNPPDFQYLTGDGVGAIKQGKASLRTNQELLQSGFRNQYAQSSLENDFNGFASALFMGEKEVWKSAEQYPSIRGKLSLTIDFFEAIDPAFSETYFRELSEK